MPKAQKKIFNVTLLKGNIEKRQYTQKFPPMPIMYLELLENKTKIRTELQGRPYEPVIPPTVPLGEKTKHSQKGEKGEKKGEREVKTKEVKIKPGNDEDTDSSDSDDSTSEDEKEKKVEKLDKNEEKDDDDASSDISDRLKELLDDDKSAISAVTSPSPNMSKYSAASYKELFNKSPYEKYRQVVIAPTLQELEEKGQFRQKNGLKDLSFPNKKEEEDEDKKREYLYKFKILEKSYPGAADIFPGYTIHTDLKTMVKGYEDSVKRLSIDSSVGTYKQYLIFLFGISEFCLGRYLGFDMNGFTSQQLVNFQSYERLLIELGEKSYVPGGSKWPVEIRLFFLVLMNSVIFIVGKIIVKKTGFNPVSMMNQTMNQTMNTPVPKRKMKGPRIILDNIPEEAENQSTQTSSSTPNPSTTTPTPIPSSTSTAPSAPPQPQQQGLKINTPKMAVPKPAIKVTPKTTPKASIKNSKKLVIRNIK